MKHIFLSLFILSGFYISCKNNEGKSFVSVKPINHAWLDSIVKNSDSTYSKPYKRTDYVTAIFYINKKDSSVCQVMKDSADSIRQVIIARKNIRIHFAQYYANGNLQAGLPLDEFGQYNGNATFYFENGGIQSAGLYNHGLKKGRWKNYNEKGALITTETYDDNGQLMK